MKSRQYFYYFVLFWLVGLTLFSTIASTPKEPKKINVFEQALVSSYLTNSDLRAKVREQFSKNESVPQALSGFRPSVRVNSNIGKTRIDNQTAKIVNRNLTSPRVRGRRTLDPASIGISVEQNLFAGGGTMAGTNSAQNFVKAGQYDYLNTEQDTLLKAVRSYMNVIFQTRSVDLNRATKEFFEQQLVGVKAEVEVGEKTITDQSEAEARLAQAVADLIAAEGDLENAKANYHTVIGEQAGLLEIPELIKDLPTSREGLIERAKVANLGILQALYEQKRAKDDIDVASADLLPSITLRGNADREFDTSIRGDRRNVYSATLNLSIPLYQTGSKWSVLRQRTQTASQSRLQLEQARKQSVESAIQAWENWTTTKEKIARFEAEVAFRIRSRDGAALEAEVGQRSYIFVLDFQNKLLGAQLRLEEAIRDEVIARYQILSVIGLLTAEYLKLSVEKYDVIGHAKAVRGQWIGTDTTPVNEHLTVSEGDEYYKP